MAASLVVLTSACASGAQSISGTWDVIKVAVNRRDQAHWLYVSDDPRLLGRELVIGPTMLTFNDGSDPCRKPAWEKRKARMGALIASSFPLDGSAVASPHDFSLDIQSAERVVANTVHCAATDDGRDPQPWSQAWFVASASAPDRLLMRMGTSAILVLQRRSPQASPRASYACRSAQGDAEKTICRSVALAGLDRSVAAALARRLRTDDSSAVNAQQAAWLKKRDACGANERCLADAMRARIDELMQN